LLDDNTPWKLLLAFEALASDQAHGGCMVIPLEWHGGLRATVTDWFVDNRGHVALGAVAVALVFSPRRRAERLQMA